MKHYIFSVEIEQGSWDDAPAHVLIGRIGIDQYGYIIYPGKRFYANVTPKSRSRLVRVLAGMSQSGNVRFECDFLRRVNTIPALAPAIEKMRRNQRGR